MKKFLKILFVIIALAAIAGCAFFGYHYFKKDGETPPPADNPPPATMMSVATAKQLVYTAAYDMGFITEAAYSLEIGSTPSAKATNMNIKDEPGEYEVDFTGLDEFEYKDYTSDNIYMITYEYYNLPFEGMFTKKVLNVVTDFFQHSEIEEDKYYNLVVNQYTTYIFSFDIVSETVLRVSAYSDFEVVLEYEILAQSNGAITDYALTIYGLDDGHADLASYYNRTSITKLEVKTKNGVKKVERYSYVFVTLSEVTVDKSFATIYVLDVDVESNKMISAENAVFENDTTTKTSISNKVRNAITENIHADRDTFYTNATKEDL